jgi:hypothetical protein
VQTEACAILTGGSAMFERKKPGLKRSLQLITGLLVRAIFIYWALPGLQAIRNVFCGCTSLGYVLLKHLQHLLNPLRINCLYYTTKITVTFKLKVLKKRSIVYTKYKIYIIKSRSHMVLITIKIIFHIQLQQLLLQWVV